MAFNELDQELINECSAHTFNSDKIQMLINSGANINAYDFERENSVYGEILDNYCYWGVEPPSLSNFYEVTKLLIKNGLVTNPNPDRYEDFIGYYFFHLPPEPICVDIFKMLLDIGDYGYAELDNVIGSYSLDLHLGDCVVDEEDDCKYTTDDYIRHYVTIIYWACAYIHKKFPEKQPETFANIDWFNREKYYISFGHKNRSTEVCVIDKETSESVEITGWKTQF